MYNTDETGLNFRALTKISLASKKEESVPGFDLRKECVIVLACSNTTGTHKLPLMVIDKSAKPRAFQK